MPKKLRSDDDDLMEIFEHYSELRRERNEYEDTEHKLECEIAGLQCLVARSLIGRQLAWWLETVHAFRKS